VEPLAAPESREQRAVGQAPEQTGPDTVPLPAPKAPVPALSQEDQNKALAEAAAKGRLEEVERLVREGADLAYRDKDGATALVVTATNGHIEVVEWIVKNGADVNARTAAGLTAIAAAVESGHPAVVELLLSKGANVNAKSEDGLTALDRATRKGAEELKAILLQHGAAPEVKTARTGETEKRESVAAQRVEASPTAGKEPEPTVKPEDKNKALIESAEKGDLDQVRRLLGAGADVNGTGSAGSTVLMTASARGNLELVKLLIEKGADPQAKDSTGKTALVYADEKGFREVKDFLQEKITPKAQDREGKAVSSDKIPQGKHRLGAMSPDTKPASGDNPK